MSLCFGSRKRSELIVISWPVSRAATAIASASYGVASIIIVPHFLTPAVVLAERLDEVVVVGKLQVTQLRNQLAGFYQFRLKPFDMHQRSTCRNHCLKPLFVL